MSAENVAQRLAAQTGESVEWPTDAAFGEAWRTQHAYRTLDNAKIVYILGCLNDTYSGSKTEAVSIQHSLTVEHILPQNWIEHWHLSDSAEGMNYHELIDADEGRCPRDRYAEEKRPPPDVRQSDDPNICVELIRVEQPLAYKKARAAAAFAPSHQPATA